MMVKVEPAVHKLMTWIDGCSLCDFGWTQRSAISLSGAYLNFNPSVCHFNDIYMFKMLY